MKTIFDKIEKDIIFFDLETTGILLKEDRIIEICAIKFKKDGSKLTYQSRINPEKEIHPQATEVHRIKNEDLVGCPTFKDLSDDLFNFFNGCDLGGYNCLLFDIPILYEEFSRCGKNINFFGETSYSIHSKSFAHLYGMMAVLDPRASISVVYRNYAPGYYPFYNNGFSEGSNTQNEKGVFMGGKFLL